MIDYKTGVGVESPATRKKKERELIFKVVATAVTIGVIETIGYNRGYRVGWKDGATLVEKLANKVIRESMAPELIKNGYKLHLIDL